MMFIYFVCILHLHFVFSGALPFDKRESPGTDLAGFLDENGKCKEDTTFHIDCNTCVCKKGLQPGCTYKLCTLGNINITRIKRELPDSNLAGFLDENGKCEEETSFKIDCNTCFCKKGFQPGCTYKLCLQNINITRIKRELSNSDSHLAGFLDKNGKCKEDTSFHIDCNTCFCRQGFQPGCTYKLCTVGYINITRNETELPNSDSGLDDFLDENWKCKQDASFKWDCNTCQCQKGSPPGCTDMLCPENLNKTVRLERDVSKSETDLDDFLDENGKCKQDASFKWDCNTCQCQKGSQPACTYKLCPENLNKTVRLERDVSKSETGKIPPGGLCKPGERWKLDECNNCVCTHNGYASCTLNDCSTSKGRPKRTPAATGTVPPGGKCKPGDRWKLDECNNCVCTHTGFASCTLNDCSPSKKRPKRTPADAGKVPPAGKCKPGERWKLDECNNCVCTHTGYASCTLNDCTTTKGRPKRSPATTGTVPPGGKCKPGDRWKLDECNNCVCTHTGFASCTLNDCSASKKRPKRTPADAGKLNPEGRCKPGERWKLDECNNCVCTHTGYASCTLNDCSSSQKRPKRESVDLTGTKEPGARCKPGEKWNLDECNKCVCTHNGFASCSLNECPQKGRTKRSTDTSHFSNFLDQNGKCKQNASFKWDCNTCNCQKGYKPGCTYAMCLKTRDKFRKTKREASNSESGLSEFVDEHGKCQQRATFRLDCNSCFCSQKGKYASCTLKACPEYKNKTQRLARDARNENGNSGLECKPGVSWKENCNSCFCSERGIAMCTDIPTCPSPPPAPAKEIPNPKSTVVTTSQSLLISSTTLESFTPSESLTPSESPSTQETSVEPASTTDSSDVSNATELVSTTEVQ